MARITMVHDIAGVAEVEARLLREAGHEVTMVRLSSLGAGWSWPWKILGLGLRLLSFLPIVARLRRHPPEILHIHWVPMGVIGVLSGRPFFLSAHGSDLHQHFRNPVLRAVSRAILRRARCVFYSTPNLAAFLAGIAAWGAGQDWQAVYQSADIDLYEDKRRRRTVRRSYEQARPAIKLLGRTGRRRVWEA